jgi:hypothetical protein
LEQLFAIADDIASSAIKRNGEIPPSWMCETDDGNDFLIYNNIISSDADLRQLFFEEGVVRYVHIFEVWLPDDYAISGSQADRRGVLLSGEDRDTEQVLTHLRLIHRTAQGAAMLSPPVSDVEGAQLSGRFCSMFEHRLNEPTRN